MATIPFSCTVPVFHGNDVSPFPGNLGTENGRDSRAPGKREPGNPHPSEHAAGLLKHSVQGEMQICRSFKMPATLLHFLLRVNSQQTAADLYRLKYQRYRYRTDTTGIGPIPIPSTGIGLSLVTISRALPNILFCLYGVFTTIIDYYCYYLGLWLFFALIVPNTLVCFHISYVKHHLRFFKAPMAQSETCQTPCFGIA